MIHLENLDSKNFYKILEEARNHIHKYNNEWTDENYHDPGITIIELLSWITEMQRYYLNNVTKISENKLLSLLSVKNNKKFISYGSVEITPIQQSLFIPKGLKLVAEDKIFETSKSFFAIKNNITDIFHYNFKNKTYIDLSEYLTKFELGYKPLGKKITKKNEFIIKFHDELPVDKTLNISFVIKEDYKIRLDNCASNKFGIKYKFIAKENYKNDYESVSNVEIIEDTTLGFKKSGIISFKINKSDKKKYKELVIEVLENYEFLPLIIYQIQLNKVEAINKNTIIKDFYSKKGYLEINDYIFKIGIKFFQILDSTGWLDAPEEDFIIKNLDDHFLINHIQNKDFRIILYDEMYITTSKIGKSTALPYQKIRVNLKNIINSELIISCPKLKNKSCYWEDYKYVDTLLESSNRDKVFTLDYEENELIFGNNEYGIIPEENGIDIMATNMVKSNFEKGNVKANKILSTSNKSFNELIKIKNSNDFVGGLALGNYDNLKIDFLKEYINIDIAITLDDYEKTIMRYPETRILYCKAENSYKGSNTLSLTVVPYTGAKFPKISVNLINELKIYLEDFSIVNTNVEIIDSPYIEVKFSISILLNNQNSFDKTKLYEAIYNLFNPIQNYNVNTSYKLGYLPTIYDVLQLTKQFEGISLVKNINILPIGKGVEKSLEYNAIPSNSVIFCKTINIYVE